MFCWQNSGSQSVQQIHAGSLNEHLSQDCLMQDYKFTRDDSHNQLVITVSLFCLGFLFPSIILWMLCQGHDAVTSGCVCDTEILVGINIEPVIA